MVTEGSEDQGVSSEGKVQHAEPGAEEPRLGETQWPAQGPPQGYSVNPGRG